MMFKSMLAMAGALVLATTNLDAQIISTFAGTGGVSGYSGDGGPATAATFNEPQGITIDASGAVYVADTRNNCVRKIQSGIVTTIAGNGTPGYSGDGGPATAALMFGPVAVAVDAAGNLYVAEGDNNAVRKISTTGIITTIAGTGTAGYNGDGIAATAAQLFSPGGVYVDASGNVYIGDSFNQRIRKVSPAGIISTYAGDGTMAYGGDGGPATSANLHNPNAVFMDGGGNLLITDNGNHAVRKIDPSGTITTIAGNGFGGYWGDGVPATSTAIYFPVGVFEDALGNVYYGEDGDYRVRKIDAFGIITTYAGIGLGGFGGDGGAATAAMLNSPTDVVMDAARNVYIVDRENYCIRMISKPADVVHFAHAPRYTVKTCRNTAVAIDSALEIVDVNVGLTETWNMTAPVHGTASSSYTATSTGTYIAPTGLIYTPTTGYYGADSMVAVVNDGASADTIKLIFQVDTSANAGTITGVDSLCPGITIKLSDPVTGGIWTSTHPLVAVVAGAGYVIGNNAGFDTVIYTVTNGCGTASAIFKVRVLTPPSCARLGVSVPNDKAEGLELYPNPNNGDFAISVNTANETNARIVIQNVMGSVITDKIIASNKAEELHLALPSGVYMLSATANGQRWSEKIVISK